MPIPPTAQAAAHRARTIAAIARTRVASPAPIPDPTGRAALLEIADRLDIAAYSFETDEPGSLDGITITNTVPVDAYLALSEAETIAEDNPTSGFPPEFGEYVTAPVYGKAVSLPPSLLPGGPVLIAQEGDLFARLLVLHAELAASTAPESIAGLLELVFRLLWKHAQLADSIAVDRNRPDSQPTQVPEIPAPATAMALRRAHDEHGQTLTFPLSRRDLLCHISDQGRTHPAARMVSHQGTTIATCDDHQDAATTAARELHNSLG
ncbi:hypothetical protein ACK03K_34135 [[Kitasatospora] papulosa]|uniref:hypothetical protein n=1 Tax=[Kitasatospora] papulosa TaxID=1464011 RepID=UPI0039083C5E